MIYTIENPEKTEEIGYKLARSLSESGIKRAFIAMRGEMGVGKTVFTRGFASYFGISGVKSPTYTIVNEYSSAETRIFHFDLYRITDSDDLASIGYDDYILKDGYVIAEWSERIPEDIPEDAVFVRISRSPLGDGYRIIEIEGAEL